MEYLTAADLVDIHPGPDRTVREPAVFDKAAALLHGVVHLHPFIDGNKRTGWLSAAVLLALNGWLLDADEDEAFDMVLAAAAGQLEVEQIASWLQERCRQLENGS